MAGIFERGLLQLESMGLADVLLPFLLIFTVVFAVMHKTKILGADKKNFNIIIALVMALAVVIPHVLGKYPPGADVVDIINTALPNVSLVAVAVIMVLLLVGLFGGESNWGGSNFAGIVAIAAFIVVGWIFYAAANPASGPASWMPAFLQDPDTQALLLIIAVFGLVIWFITKEPSTRDTPGWRMGEMLKDFFKPGSGHH